jgi:hypothetical protein
MIAAASANGAVTAIAGSSCLTRNMPLPGSTSEPTHHGATKALASVASVK